MSRRKRYDSPQGLERFRQGRREQMPRPMPRDPARKLIKVYVEGYEDVAFWRGIFDDYETAERTFEIGVPPRDDLAKGKKVILAMVAESSPQCLLCVDSDFDWLLADSNEQSHAVNTRPWLFHTYAYATENFLCYAPSLHNVCVKATKNDTRIFDFETFMREYSLAIYPLFVWYAYSAFLRTQSVFTLMEFKSAVKLNYLEVEDNGRGTIEWLRRQVNKWLRVLEERYHGYENRLSQFEQMIKRRGVRPEDTYMYMQGHTLMDNVVLVMLSAVCEKLKQMSILRINASTKTGVALKNELSNYNNALRPVRDVLLDNEAYKDAPLYRRLQQDIEKIVRS